MDVGSFVLDDLAGARMPWKDDMNKSLILQQCRSRAHKGDGHASGSTSLAEAINLLLPSHNQQHTTHSQVAGATKSGDTKEDSSCELSEQLDGGNDEAICLAALLALSSRRRQCR
jgi:hypothetical protein